MQLKHAKSVILITLILFIAVHVQGLVTPGRITVYSTPPGAVACIDTTDCDTTTATFTAGGNSWHTVVITSPGYLQWSDYVYVTSDQNAVVNADLEESSSSTGIQVFVKPGSGTVCLDKVQCHMNVGIAGSTGSTQFAGVTEGYHTITVGSPAGFQDFSKEVYVTMGRFTTLNIELVPYFTPVIPVTQGTPATGNIRVYIDRVGSTVCIDNANCRDNVGGAGGPGSGTTLFSDVTVGTLHTISVALDGYEPYSLQVSVGKDQVNTVDVALEPLASGTTVPASASSLSPAGQNPVPTKAGVGILPVLGALSLCGAVILVRNSRK